MDEVVLVVEMTDGGASAGRLEADLRQALGVRIGCRAVALGTLPAAELKSKRIVTVVDAPQDAI